VFNRESIGVHRHVRARAMPAMWVARPLFIFLFRVHSDCTAEQNFSDIVKATMLHAGPGACGGARAKGLHHVGGAVSQGEADGTLAANWMESAGRCSLEILLDDFPQLQHDGKR
jgi:hypothetical protein